MKKTLTLAMVAGMMLITASIFAAKVQTTNGGLYILPVGSQVLWSNVNNIPEDFISEAPNKEISKAQYPELYKVIGDIYGTPANPDNFVLPYNLVPVSRVNTNFSAMGTVKINTTYQAPQDMFVFSYATLTSGHNELMLYLGSDPNDMNPVVENGNNNICLGGGSSVFAAVPKGYYFTVYSFGTPVNHGVNYIQLGSPLPVPPVGANEGYQNQSTKSTITNQCWIIKAA